jgi:hypothetical protein
MRVMLLRGVISYLPFSNSGVRLLYRNFDNFQGESSQHVRGFCDAIDLQKFLPMKRGVEISFRVGLSVGTVLPVLLFGQLL